MFRLRILLPALALLAIGLPNVQATPVTFYDHTLSNQPLCKRGEIVTLIKV